ncbi:tripartite motif-containing protein 66-like [Ruditapes philippinarum]|uniref:tripartite motif-containing protein 66-like n=1 Tax=Ruditapes philippinarum TaxID=129788 RepID=UPI00295AD0C5|nr:tripartite motif-containing protein 66-like [Ruditapes philippinarum]
MADGGEDDEVPGRVEDILCKRRDKEIMCQPCLSKDKKIVADKFCSTCNEFQCIDCSGVHNVLAIFKSQKLLNANVAHVIRCDQHTKVLDYFCEDENKLCCRTCAIVDHRACKSIAEVGKIIGKMTSSSSDLDDILQEAKDNAEDIARDIITSKDQLVQDVQEIHAKIREMRDEVMRMFVELEVAIVKRAKTLQKETLDNLEKKQLQIEKHLHRVTAYLETVQSIFETGTPTQKFIAEQKMGNEVNFVCRNVNEECQNFQTMTISFDFDEQLNLPPKSITDFVPGHLTLKYHSREIVNAVNKVMTLTPGSSIGLKKTGDDFEQPFFSGIDFLSDGRLVAVDNNNKKFLVYNEKFENVGSYQLSFYPLSVVAVSEDEVAITSGNEYIIDFLRVSKANEIR